MGGRHTFNWISEQLEEFDHEVTVENVLKLRAISHSDPKSVQVDAEKLAPLFCGRSHTGRLNNPGRILKQRGVFPELKCRLTRVSAMGSSANLVDPRWFIATSGCDHLRERTVTLSRPPAASCKQTSHYNDLMHTILASPARRVVVIQLGGYK
jgi:hypothetical protein